jgi:hypothetical protein
MNNGWSNFDSGQYESVIKNQVAMGRSPLWEIEQHWRAYQSRDVLPPTQWLTFPFPRSAIHAAIALIPPFHPLSDFVPAFAGDFGVDRGVGDVGMAEVILDCDVFAALQQARRKVLGLSKSAVIRQYR